MIVATNVWKILASPWCDRSTSSKKRRPKRAELAWDCLEDRVVLSHIGGGFRHAHAHVLSNPPTATSTSSSSTATGTGTGTGTSTSTNTALTTALQALR